MKSSIFIITRFNLKLWGKDKNNQTTLSDKWLIDFHYSNNIVSPV